MKKFAMLCVLSLASVAGAAETPLGAAATLGQPVLSVASPTPVPDAVSSPVVVSPSAAVPLYTNVKYRDERNIAPCAVPTIVMVPDPCNDCGCVAVQICVPPCETPCVKTKRCGHKVVYDYGKYSVEITSARGKVVVDYDD